jgi:hypothetical protein
MIASASSRPPKRRQYAQRTACSGQRVRSNFAVLPLGETTERAFDLRSFFRASIEVGICVCPQLLNCSAARGPSGYRPK